MCSKRSHYTTKIDVKKTLHDELGFNNKAFKSLEIFLNNEYTRENFSQVRRYCEQLDKTEVERVISKLTKEMQSELESWNQEDLSLNDVENEEQIAARIIVDLGSLFEVLCYFKNTLTILVPLVSDDFEDLLRPGLWGRIQWLGSFTSAEFFEYQRKHWEPTSLNTSQEESLMFMLGYTHQLQQVIYLSQKKCSAALTDLVQIVDKIDKLLFKLVWTDKFPFGQVKGESLRYLMYLHETNMWRWMVFQYPLFMRKELWVSPVIINFYRKRLLHAMNLFNNLPRMAIKKAIGWLRFKEDWIARQVQDRICSIILRENLPQLFDPNTHHLNEQMAIDLGLPILEWELSEQVKASLKHEERMLVLASIYLRWFTVEDWVKTGDNVEKASGLDWKEFARLRRSLSSILLIEWRWCVVEHEASLGLPRQHNLLPSSIDWAKKPKLDLDYGLTLTYQSHDLVFKELDRVHEVMDRLNWGRECDLNSNDTYSGGPVKLIKEDPASVGWRRDRLRRRFELERCYLSRCGQLPGPGVVKDLKNLIDTETSYASSHLVINESGMIELEEIPQQDESESQVNVDSTSNASNDTSSVSTPLVYGLVLTIIIICMLISVNFLIQWLYFK